MSVPEAHRAIEAVWRLESARIIAGLARLVNDVGDNPDQLSILQHALNRTWAQWQHQGQGQNQLSLSHYEAIGTMAHALNQHAEKAFAELATSREQKICEKMFKALTDVGTDARGVRRPRAGARRRVLGHPERA